MKKKLSSFVTAMFVLLICVFASACGDKYKNLEFKVYYAFTEDAETWFDASKGISLNYGLDNGGGEEEASLVFDEYGATIYLKVEVENVDSKHIDKITVSPNSTEGLDFSPVMVNQGQVFALPITGIVDTSLKLYENNSGKKYELPIEIYRKLEAIDVVTSFKPAMPLTANGGYGTISLTSLEKDLLVYQPFGQTNQKGVTYSIESIGRYVEGDTPGVNEYVEKYNQGYAQLYASVDDGVLKINDGSFFGLDAYVIRVKATSIFYDGSIEGVDPIYTIFDIYVVDSETRLESPLVKFDGGEEVEKQINIYENSSDYATSTVVIDMEELPDDLVYSEGVLTSDGVASYKTVFYVLDETGEYKKCSFDNQGNGENADESGIVGINGLYIKREDGGKFTFSIASRDIVRNKVKIAYELEGFDYSHSQVVDVSKEIDVVKGVVPTGIRVNDTKTLKQGDTEIAQVLSINNEDYFGLKLKLAANQTSSSECKIEFESNPNLIITNEKHEVVSWIYSGETVYVKFTGNKINTTLNIKTLNVPDYYNEGVVNQTGYLTISYELKKLVTADSFEFVASSNGNELVGNALINAAENDSIFVKVNYSGESLVTSTIKLTSQNEKVLFGNGTNEFELSDALPKSSGATATGKYDIYEIPMLATNNKELSKVTITAGDENFVVSSDVNVESVFVVDKANEEINVDAESEGGVREFTADEVNNDSFNFAIAKNETAYFTVKDAAGESKTIAEIDPQIEVVDGNNFSNQLFIPSYVTTSSFQVYSNVSGKTQVLQVTVKYYVIDDDIVSDTYGQIINKSQTIRVQIAVFDSVGVITRTPSNQTIGYVNKYYNDIRLSEVAFRSNSYGGGTPSNTVVFAGVEPGLTIEKSGASQIMLKFNAGIYQTLVQSEIVDIYYVVNGNKTSLISNNGTMFIDNKGTETKDDDTNILNGSFVVELKNETELNSISMTLTALRFGVVSNTSIDLTINIAEVDKAKRILVDGDFTQTSANSNELQMSFMNVVDGGVAVAEFDASVEFETQTVPEGKIRFDDINTALTYVLYRYQLDENGNPKQDASGNAIYTRIENDFLNVKFENGKVKIQASKDFGGGRFKFVLVSKDSYNQNVDPDSIDLEEDYFDTKYSLIIDINDGTKQNPFDICAAEDLLAINNNLDKHFTLRANIGEDGAVDITPLGVTEISGNTLVKPFTGGLSGQFTTIYDENKSKVSSYSIKIKINKTVNSTEYGTLAGLFAILGEEANINNLTLKVEYAPEFSSTENKGLHIGSLAGINNGTINNVQTLIEQPSDVLVGFETAGLVRLGGVVGSNNGEIYNSRSESYSTLKISSNEYATHSIGLIAGVNEKDAIISGSYNGKDSLNNYIYDVVADIKVVNTNELNDGNVVKYYVGAVAGVNAGVVERVLVGGQISMSSQIAGELQSGAIGGVVGFADKNSKVYLATALSLNITSSSSLINVGGVVGDADTATIDTVKYISVITEIDGEDVLGILSGKALIGGVVANALAGSIKYASVESFIETYNEAPFHTIQGGTAIAGLAHTSGTNVENSFVNAGITSTGAIYLTTNSDEDNTYFIGKVNGTVSGNKTDYSIVNGLLNNANINVSNYMVDIAVNESTTDWTNIYYVDATNYVNASEYDATKTYKKLDAAAWQAYVYGLVGLTEANTTWVAEKDYNIVKVNGVELFFPYLLREYKITLVGGGEETKYEPLQVVRPQAITAEINQNYVTSSESVYVKEFDYSKYAPLVKETIVVNFFKDAGDEANTHNLFTSEDVDGLLNLSILPNNAQGGYNYEIIGDGHNFAYINSRKQIVFTRSSNQTPVLVRVYSVFNNNIEIYVAFYSQSLSTTLTLNSTSVYYSGEPTHDYEMNVYTGQNNKIMALGAENVLDGNIYQDVLDVESLSQYLTIKTESTNANSKLSINSESSQNITLRIRDNLTDAERIGAEEYEIITFELWLNAEYFGSYTIESIEYPHVQEDVLVGTIKLKVNLYNSATSIDVNGSDAEITTSDDIDLTVTLTTEFVKESLYDSATTRIEGVKVNSDGELCYDAQETDGIRIKFEIVEGVEEVDRLCEINGVDHFSELFMDNAQILSSLYKAKDGKVLGYQYKVFLELNDKHNVRYISNNIKFNIIVYALSNSEINNESNPIEFLLKPATFKTAKMENYVVKSLNMFTDYTNIVASDKNIETSIIEPGGLGNIMMIYLEPTYSKVTSVSIQTSSIFVPSQGKHVQVKFTQLALDHRASEGSVFTTLSAERVNTQVDDTLELNLISEIDKYGNDVYTGILCVRVHIEEPFVGLEASMTISLNVKTEGNPEGITRTKELLTSYLPGAEISYNGEWVQDKDNHNGYLIQKGTSNNEVTLKIYGYQFNSNPDIEIIWELPTESTFTYVGGNKGEITDGTNTYLIGDYVSYYLDKDINNIVYNSHDDSYTLKLLVSVAENIPAPFRLSAELYVVTKDGQLETSPKEDNTLVFYPTEYILNSVYVEGLTDSGRKNIPINKTREIALKFVTDSEIIDLSETIYQKLLQYAKGCDLKALEENGITTNKLASLFSYYKNGGTITFADTNLYSEFEYNLVNEEIISITGLEKFSSIINFSVNYEYKFVEGEYTLVFGPQGKPLSTTFTLNIVATDEKNEIVVYTAEDIYNSTTRQWNLVEGESYVLLNDIELEQVVPITTKIAGFDGNNRVISIKSFAVDSSINEYGLFANIGTYTVEDIETEEQITRQTILKNMIVDYSKFEGTLALNNLDDSNIVFGGLVGTNNGGLIYNCDVMNLDASKVNSNSANIDVIVADDASVIFGGLVGVNNGNITHSRVGRASYTKITATPTTESTVVKHAGGLSFSIFNKEGVDEEVNQFVIKAGGFVGENSGIISSSFVANTNLHNYSTNETTNITAGFVGNNKGTISYSYTKADEETITTLNPYSKGYVIENLGNGIVSGFVYDNSGIINNSYSNLELKTESAYISGFVYSNTGTISESYAATTMNSGLVDSYAEQPFIGVNSKGDLLSNGTLENTYYLMRSTTDNPYTDEDKDVAHALNEDNFQNSEYLVGFAFVLSNSKVEREQGIWSYYTTTNKKRVLPELMNANLISHSYRFVVDSTAQNVVLRNAVSYAEGTQNNPHIVSNVKEFNDIFTGEDGTNRNLVGHVRLINNINFNDDETAIKTRSNYTLGSTESSKTSVEGNGMTISGIYLDVGDAIVSKIGLFAEIQNAYVKNMNLEFATPKTDGQFSTITATYSGGLAGLIENSAIFNVTLNGENTTLTGSNFVGGVAGLIKGNSLIYGIETDLNVKANGNENYLYYSSEDYQELNIKTNSRYEYSNYLKHLSYAGGVAGVLDLTKRANIDYNVQFVDVRGDQMSAKTFDGKPEANIIAEYAGGIAGYASRETNGFKLRYFVGESESVRGDTAVGGLFGVGLGGITASQVTAEEDTQFEYDTTIGQYIMALDKLDAEAKLDSTKIGNTTLLEGDKYVGGLIGLGIDAKINASYSKASITSGEIVGGLVGLSVAGSTNYSYAIPLVNLNEDLKSVGGLIGAAYEVSPRTLARNSAISTYETLIKHKGVVNKVTDVQFTYSTLIIDESQFETLTEEQQAKINNVTFDYICADYDAENSACLQSNQNSSLMYVYAGPVDYTTIDVKNQTNETSKSSIVDLHRLYNVGDPDQVVAFQEVFSGWALIKYWSLNDKKYFPLLNNEAVDNFIEIDHANDLELIKLNPNGKFKVINDIQVPNQQTNWIISGKFTGVLVGELENDSRRPTITMVGGLNPNTNNTSSGFFEETNNATISNLSFVWVGSQSKAAIETNSLHITMVSALTCKDENSLISNVEVRVQGETKDDAYLLKDATIGGFGGIVGEAVNTNILGCNFIGKVKATVKNADAAEIYVGGAVGYAVTNNNNGDSVVINNVSVGAENELSTEFSNVHYATTSLDLTISSDTTSAVYVGGSVGKANNVAIATNRVGSIGGSEEYKQVDVSINLNNSNQNVYAGGIVGYASDGMISNSETSTNITMYGQTSGSMLKAGGLIAEYSLTNPSSTTGIAKCYSYSNISTCKDESNVLNTGVSTQTMLSTGVAMLGGGATLKQGLFTGAINTEGSKITQLYSGGAVAQVKSSENYIVDIEEITTDSVLTVGTDKTTSLYAGGLVGYENKLNISYSSALGRIIPITQFDAEEIYVGGLIGTTTEKANVNNSYSLTSIVADSIADESIANLSIGALVGSIPEGSTSGEDGNINFTNVFYSSDYALFADENYLQDETTLGTNLSATTMIRNSAWHTTLRTENEEQNGIWTAIVSNDGTTRIPHLLALEEAMIKFGILTKPTGATAHDYIYGSAMRPILIETSVASDYVFDSENYKYYLLTLSEDRDATRKMVGALNGILIGEDETIENTFRVGELSDINEFDTYRGIISRVMPHSAISNLHVVVDSEISITDTEFTGIIAGLNDGVIFNSSVQGNGIKITGSGTIGLIAAHNNGMISHSYSTAEVIVEENVEISGIVHTNEGKLLSNYFNGYIEGGEAAGVVYIINIDKQGYAYNNYMAGVITNIKSNAFFACETIKGSNNYIDSYSDILYTNKNYLTEEEKTNAHAILTPVQTADLMAGNGLAGDWYVVVESGVFDTTLNTFGLNYNYPIYKFNKLISTDGETYTNDDYADQLYTGTGGNSVTEAFDNKEVDLRYSYVVNNTQVGERTIDTQYYHAFKIPHLGVLTAVHNLLNDSRNYVVIYDINGEISKDLNVEWEAIGSDMDINGFIKSGTFKGVFVTNKYFAYNTHLTLELEKVSDAYCLIKNLSGRGLFDVVNDAYVGNIKLGSFHNLKNSGAIGATIETETENNSQYAYVNNVEFVKNSTISGTEYFGGLFGEVKGELIVGKFISSTGVSANLCLAGDLDSRAGLIAGKASGTIDLQAIEEDGKLLSTYYAWFKANDYAGGIVGELSDGYIKGNENTVTLTKTSQSGANVDVFTNVIGGVAGLTTGTQTHIDSLNINIQGTEIKTNTFGGLVGQVDAEVITNELIKMTGASTITFIGNQADNRYYGLIAGLQNANISVGNFQATAISKLTINCVENPNYNEEETTSGIGTFVGATLGGNIDVSYNLPAISLEIEGVPNVGGFIGYVNEIRTINFNGTVELNISGTTNVGGVFGYLKGDILSDLEALTGSKFATIQINGPNIAGIEYKNFGGLFGRWEGSNISNKLIINHNEIVVGQVGAAYNVGGIAGKVKSSSILNGFLNNGGFSDGDLKFYDTTTANEINSSILEEDTQIDMCKLMNVGGVFGLVEDAAEISNIKNEKDILGYQNVGGVIGYLAAELVTVKNNTDKDMSNIRAAYDIVKTEFVLYYDTNNNKTYDEDSDIILSDGALSGIACNVYGVINVGGIIGYAGNGVTIEQIYSTSNVYGNLSVGGIVGLCNESVIKNNCIIGSVENGERNPVTGETEIIRTGAVKGIYYNYVTFVDENEIVNSFIPTSVGGLVGTSIDSTLENNLLNGVQILSTKESEGEVISTINNYMADLSIGESNAEKIEDFINSDEIYNLDTKNKIYFSDIRTGFGGMVGTLDTATMEKIVITEDIEIGQKVGFSIESNYLVDIEIDAELGVNVGTYFGAYKFTNSINITIGDSSESVVLVAPKLYSTKDILNPVTSVNGAYNIGGIVGYVDGGTGATTFNLSNANLYGYSKINLQSRIVGIHVGGLIGKTNSNSITGLEIVTNNNVNLGAISDASNLQSVKILIHTDNCFYAGGLIGRAEVSADAIISGNFGKWVPNEGATAYEIVAASDWVLPSNQDDRFNFGALIGLLKLGITENGITVQVEGNHNLPFTVNTIENSNYYDGDSRFNEKKYDKDPAIYLFAEAYYVNKDSFIIAGTQNEGLYSADAKNPLNANYKGWSKQYTGFKQLQRNIPVSENNGAEWDSIIPLYNAEKIKHVGTIENLGLWPSYTGDKDKDYICFTVYEESEVSERLYSAIGSAAASPNYDMSETDKDGNDIKEINQTYLTVKDIEAGFKEWIGGILSGEHPYQEYYIDANNPENGLQTLEYLTYGYSSEWGYVWKEYTSLGGTTGVTLQNTCAGYDDNKEPINGNIKYLSYFVEDYFGGDVKYGDKSGAYFVFDVLYNNASLSNLPYNSTNVSGKSNEEMAKSGSIFDIAGIYDTENLAARRNENGNNWFKTLLTVVEIVIDVIVIFCTFGGGSIFTAAKNAFKFIAKRGFKRFVSVMFRSSMRKLTSALGKHAFKRFAKFVGSSLRSIGKRLAIATATIVTTHFAKELLLKNQLTSSAESNYVQPHDYHYGLLSSTYNKNIRYEKNKDGDIVLKQDMDDLYISENGTPYYYFSSIRPKDYHTNVYLGTIEKVTSTKVESDKVVEIETRVLNDEEINDEDLVYNAQFGYKDLVWIDTISVISVIDDERITETQLVGQDDDGNYWTLDKKYVFINGQYYINANAGNVDVARVTLDFTPETYNDDLRGATNCETPNWIDVSGGTYVHGDFDSNASAYVYNNDYPGNNLTYDRATGYTLNSQPILDSVAEHQETEFNYVVDESKTVNSINAAPQNKYILGYDYFDRVYFTANGKSGMTYYDGDLGRDVDLVKYATFEFVEEYNTGSDYSSYGTKGVDYVIKEYKHSGIVYSSSGNFFKYGDVEYNLNTTTRFFYNEETGMYEENRSGNYILVSENYVEIQNRYNKDPIKSGVFKIVTSEDFSYNGTETNLTANPQSLTAGNRIMVAVYPSTFVNPYKNYNKSSATDIDNFTNNKYSWLYDMDNVNSGIMFAPKYYAYDGGYKVQDDIVYLVVYNRNDDETSEEYVQISQVTNLKDNKVQTDEDYNYLLSDNTSGNSEKLTYGEVKDLPLKDLYDNFEKYQNYFIKNEDAFVCELFIKDATNGILYKANLDYLIGEEGLLNKIEVSVEQADHNMYNRMYLSNKKVGLYTRYRYMKNGRPVTFEQSPNEWHGYSVVPTNGTAINYNRETTFVETSRVILGGGTNVRLYGAAGSYAEVNSGTISVS